jgi:hypothetical protein
MGVLHRAGILDGVEATAPATRARRLRAEGNSPRHPQTRVEDLPERGIFSAAGAATVHPSTIALAWHPFGDQAGRDLFALTGPPMLTGPPISDHAETTAAVQAAWEDVLPPAA